MDVLIKELKYDHELISEKLEELLVVLTAKDFRGQFNKLSELMNFFESFAFSEHHKREENVLYKWMLEQNKSSDKELIQKIVDEHRYLEELAKDIRVNINLVIDKNDNSLVAKVGADLSFMVSKYTEHVDRESNFIFEIASALSRK